MGSKYTPYIHSFQRKTSVSSILQYQPRSLHLYLLRDDVCPLLKRDIENVWAYLQHKNFDRPFPSHHSTNKQWLADLLYI